MKESTKNIDSSVKTEKINELTTDFRQVVDNINNFKKDFWKKLDINKLEDLDNFLESCKNYIFQDEFKKNEIMTGNLDTVMELSKQIKNFKPEPKPKSFFILFQAVFNLFQSKLDQKYIMDYTDKILNFLKGLEKRLIYEIVLPNFKDLFEVLIFLKVNRVNQGNMEILYKKLDGLLKDSLNSEQMKNNNEYINSICELINLKIETQQYVIFVLLVDYLEIIAGIKPEKTINQLNLFHAIIKPIFKLQMDKNTEVAKNADKCYKALIEDDQKNNIIRTKFLSFYQENQRLMNDIFSIATEESKLKNNKINKDAWNLLRIFLEEWSCPFQKSPEKKASASLITNKRANSEKKGGFEKRNPNLDSNINNKLNSSNLQGNKISISLLIPYNLFPETISVIIMSYECKIDKEDKDGEIITNKMISIIRKMEKTDIFQEEITKIILSGIKNKNIKYKEKLKPWIDLLFSIYNKSENKKLIQFYFDYIESISLEDMENYKPVDILIQNVFANGKKENIEIILEKLFNKIINSKEIMNKEQIYQIFEPSIDIYYQKNKNLLNFLEMFANVLYKISMVLPKEQKDNNKFKFNILNFVETIVCLLTDLLLNKSISNLRVSFSINDQKTKDELFSKLYFVWSINPISVLLLCIILEYYELAYNIILNLKFIKYSNDIYKKLEKLVEIFAKDNNEYVRQKLLEPTENIFFIKTLFGILMILPQGEAFDYLSDKLSSVQTLIKVENKLDKEYMLQKIKENKEAIDEKIQIFLKKQESKNQNKI